MPRHHFHYKCPRVSSPPRAGLKPPQAVLEQGSSPLKRSSSRAQAPQALLQARQAVLERGSSGTLIQQLKSYFKYFYMNQHIERFQKFQETGERLLPPPTIFDLDPIIPKYIKFGQEGHIYIVKPPGLDEEQNIFKIGSTTQLLKRMYWYEQGTELLYAVYVPKDLRQIEKSWIKRLQRDKSFRLVKGREYFDGSWKHAIDLLPSF
jgi:hypothetical protein